MATKQQITQWAAARGFEPEMGYCVVSRFAAMHGGALPVNLAELCAWANATGLRRVDGSWVCSLPELPSGGGGVDQPTGEGPHGWSDWLDTKISDIRAFTYQNPGQTAVILVVGYMVLMSGGWVDASKRRRRRSIEVKELW